MVKLRVFKENTEIKERILNKKRLKNQNNLDDLPQMVQSD